MNNNIPDYNKIFKDMTDSFKKIGIIYTKMVKSFEPVAQALTSISKWFLQHSQVFESITKNIKRAAEHYNLSEKEVVSILRKYKWFITPSMPIGIIWEIIKIDKEGNGTYKRINYLFVDYFFRDNYRELEEIVLKWFNKGLFRKRMKILKDCLYCVKSNQNNKINIVNAVLPTLIAQIDGIMAEYIISKGGSVALGYSDIKREFNRYKTKVLTSRLDDLANDMFLDIFLQTSHKFQPLENPFNFNRHKIMHGENVRYGRKVYLIRAFLILDFLSGLR